MSELVLEAKHIQKIYGKKNEKQHEALKDISFEVEKGEFVGIMGPSGSGKTTLLNILSALDQPTNGDITIANAKLNHLSDKQLTQFRGQHIGFVFQDFNLLENLTMRQNMALPLSLQGIHNAKIERRVDELADRLGLSHIMHHYPTEVSGGQKQRVAAARALVHHPDILLADEPTGALDSKNARTLLNTLKQLNEELATTILMVTHDPMSASYCQRILFIKDGLIQRELKRGESQQDFYQEILEVLSEAEVEQVIE